MKVFIVNGQGGCGKTTFERTVTNFAWKMDKKEVRVISMIDGIKEIAKGIGWNGSKTEKDRKFLADLKDVCDDYNDFSYDDIIKKVENYRSREIDAVFIDARSPKDIERLSKKFNAKTILITRGDPKNYGNHADDEVFAFDYDITIPNNGSIDWFKSQAKSFYFQEIFNGN